MNDPNETPPRRATNRENSARFVAPQPRAQKSPAHRRPPDAVGFRRLPSRIHLGDMHTTKEVRSMRAATIATDFDRDYIMRYACGGLGDT